MKRKILGTLVLVFIIISCSNKQKTVEWISSSPESAWQTKQLKAIDNKNNTYSSISIFCDSKQQLIDGFGGCFNELGWEALNSLTPENRETIFKSLFDTISGCKFNICRMPIGANDYAVDWYSHNESKYDFDMNHFSIERDKQRLIPYITMAKTYNPRLKIWASPWCPPSWMKTNNHYACNPDTVNNLTEEGRGKEMETQFRMEDKYLTAYSLYFSKFIQEYNKEGINIYAVHVQNEPNSCQIFPSCIWNPSALATFIGDYLGPQFKKDKIQTEIWLGTIERPQIDRIDTILNHPEARKYISGIGFQWAGKDAIPEVHKKYPDYKLMQTETECGNGSNNWKAAEHTFDLIKHYFNNGANAYMYWNMVLNETGKSQWGWKQNSMITIDSKTREVTYNPEFYLMKHFSYFIKPGANKIETSDKNCLAFKNPDSIVVVYYNSAGETKKKFIIGDIEFNVILLEKSFNTFRIQTVV
jgi:glucosylceramidase